MFVRWVRPGPEIPQGLRFGVLAWLFGPVPMYLLWQLVLDLFTMLVLGTLTSILTSPRRRRTISCD